MIRPATHKDVKVIADIAIESVSNNPLPVRIDREAMEETITEALGNNHFLWVSEIDGEVIGAVGALCTPGFWFERQQCSVLLYYTRKPGEGIKLLSQFMRWVKSRPAIKIAVVELEPETDPRLIKYLRRIGMSRQSMNVTYVRGMS